MESWEGEIPILEAESCRQAGIEPAKQEIHSPQKSLLVPFIVSLEPKHEQPEKLKNLRLRTLPCYTTTPHFPVRLAHLEAGTQENPNKGQKRGGGDGQ